MGAHGRSDEDGIAGKCIDLHDYRTTYWCQSNGVMMIGDKHRRVGPASWNTAMRQQTNQERNMGCRAAKIYMQLRKGEPVHVLGWREGKWSDYDPLVHVLETGKLNTKNAIIGKNKRTRGCRLLSWGLCLPFI